MSRHSDPIACSSIEEQLEAYVDGDLGSTERTTVARHVDDCPSCRRQLELAESVRSELRALPQYDAPPAVIEQVIAVARAEEDARTVHWWRTWRVGLVGGLAAAALAVVVLSPLVRSGGGASVTGGSVDGGPVAGSSVEVARQVDEIEVRRAAEEARLAIAFVARASRRTGLELRDELIVERLAVPAATGLRVLGRRPRQEERTNDET